MKISVEKTPFEGVLVLQPEIFRDERGYFMETFRAEHCESVCKVRFVQDNESLSQQGVIRALHFQVPPFGQAKLVRVLSGSIIDVMVDLRKDSPTFGKHYKIKLSAANRKQVFIPVGFAHGFAALENDTLVQYKCSAYYHPQAEGSLRWNDPVLDIDWGIRTPILSDKDRNAPLFENFDSPF